jgi:hypothetical protein
MLPGYRTTEYQPPLFDAPLKAAGSMRNICGEFVELCTAKVTGARRLKTDSNAVICPDLHYEDRTWFECKSVGKSNFSIIYSHRWEKECQFVVDGNAVMYWIWNHAGKVGSADTPGNVRREVAEKLKAVYVVSHPVLSDLLQGLPVDLNTHYYTGGPGRKTYRGTGWKVPISRLRNVTAYMGRTAPMHIRGIFVRSVPIYTGV